MSPGPTADRWNTLRFPTRSGSTGTKIGENIGFLRDRVADIDTLAAKTGTILEATERLEDITKQLVAGTHISRESAEQLQAISNETRDHLADFDDFFRPMRNYFYWEPHCFDIPICWAIRSLYDSLDGVDKLTQELGQYGARHHDYRRRHPAGHSPDRDGGVEPAGDSRP